MRTLLAPLMLAMPVPLPCGGCGSSRVWQLDPASKGAAVPSAWCPTCSVATRPDVCECDTPRGAPGCYCATQPDWPTPPEHPAPAYDDEHPVRRLADGTTRTTRCRGVEELRSRGQLRRFAIRSSHAARPWAHSHVGDVVTLFPDGRVEIHAEWAERETPEFLAEIRRRVWTAPARTA